MNYKNRKKKLQLHSALFQSFMEEPTYANFQTISNTATLDINGSFKMIIIKFAGNVFINNTLPHGYSIRINKDTIIIRNIMLRALPNNLLFRFSGTFSPKRALIFTYGGKKITSNVFDKNKLSLINISKTKVEDETLIIRDEVDYKSDYSPVNKIDDDSIKGLYTNTPFEDGYVGYYNYHPTEKIYMTGKVTTNTSIPINSNKIITNLQKKNLSKVHNKIRLNLKRRGLTKVSLVTKTPEVKPEVKEHTPLMVNKTAKKDILKKAKIIKGGKY